MKRKNCFQNSQGLAIRERATYVEGLCAHVGTPWLVIVHGWLTLDGEHAIDVTLPDAENRGYFGIAFEEKALTKALHESGYHESFLGLSTTMDTPPQLAEALRQLSART